MKASEVVQLSNTELKEKLEFAKEKLSKLKLSHSVSPIENPLLIKAARRDVARLLTEINKRNKELNQA
jgi:large subunit ribosomal protein L29